MYQLRVMKFQYGENIYPVVTKQEEDYEEMLVLIPESTGDFFLAKITSDGGYELLDEIAASKVTLVEYGEVKCPRTDG